MRPKDTPSPALTHESNPVDLTNEAVLENEVIDVFESVGLRLSDDLRGALQENKYRYDEQTGQNNRKGSGFTTATRILAEVLESVKSMDDERVRRFRVIRALFNNDVVTSFDEKGYALEEAGRQVDYAMFFDAATRKSIFWIIWRERVLVDGSILFTTSRVQLFLKKLV